MPYFGDAGQHDDATVPSSPNLAGSSPQKLTLAKVAE
jgi:hypothetical protein